MGQRTRWRRVGAVVLAVALVAAACGDDGDSDAVTDDTSAQGAEASSAEPQRGGEITTLLYADVASLDPIRSTGSGGSDANHMFPFYGALLTLNPETVELEPLLAESLEPNADFTVWTLKLKDGIVFSDGSPYDAAAIMSYWTRIKDPANRSPGVTTALTIQEMRVVDTSTLEVRLATPNAHFDRAVERQSFNYVPSAQAVAAGDDFTSKPVGAGPFVLDEWLRDSHMSMSPNPDWVGSDGPYVDKYTIRILPDELQRSNAFLAGEGDLTIVNSVAEVIDAGTDAGASWHFVTTPTSPAFTFNTQEPPFNDVRVRRAFVQAIDHQAMVEAAGATTPAETWTYEDSPWYEPEARIPQYDAAAAQALFNEVAAEQGGPIRMTIGASQGSLDLARAKLVQTSLSQYDNVQAEVEVLDGATRIGKVLNREYEVSSWGFPWMDPEPNLYNYAHTGSFSNYAGYSNPEVDAALEAARVTRDFDERKELYSKVLRQMAEDVVWFPTFVSEAGFLAASHVQDVEMYHEYILRSDLLWRES